MIGGLKATLAFAGVTLLGAGILAANLGAPQARNSSDYGGYNDAEYVPPPESETHYPSSEAYGSSEQESVGEFASDDELLDDTTGFDPSAGAMSSETGIDTPQSEGDTVSSTGSEDPGEGIGEASTDDT